MSDCRRQIRRVLGIYNIDELFALAYRASNVGANSI